MLLALYNQIGAIIPFNLKGIVDIRHFKTLFFKSNVNHWSNYLDDFTGIL